MGCLTVKIWDKTACDIKTNVTARNSVPVVSVIPAQGKMDVGAENRNVIIVVMAQCKNSIPDITASCRNTELKVTVGLVCKVGQAYQTFYVMQGPFIVEEGYFRVANS